MFSRKINNKLPTDTPSNRGISFLRAGFIMDVFIEIRK
jgi:hypothetical protein